MNHAQANDPITLPTAETKIPDRLETRFAYPKGATTTKLCWSRKGWRLNDAMRDYAKSRLLPKLQARTADRPHCNRYDDLDVEFLDGCVYLRAWLGWGSDSGIAEFPFARLYPVKGGRYNLSVRRLIDWSRAEDEPLMAVVDAFWNQAPNAKFWVRLAAHKTFEQCIDLLLTEPMF